MSVHHFKSLLFKSAQIQEEIEKEQNRRWPDWMRLLKLKKIRLAIKDRMERIVQQGAYGRGGGNFQPVRITMAGRRTAHNH
ncbi:MAG: DUF465 domain-containing protein [Alphaproteobacteria bacterium PRO2]|nr:DUF465 domain-containing protein [Alphaproteobacteria bacterium PRO2]